MVLEDGQCETAHVTMDGDVPGDEVKTESTPTDTQAHKAHPRNGVPKSQLQKRPKKPKAENKLASVIRQWLGNALPQPVSPETVESLVSQAPKRWVIYEPMLLLPTGSFGFMCVPGQLEPVIPSESTIPPVASWRQVLSSTSDETKSELWRNILTVLSPGSTPSSQLTHLAVNEGIPLHVGGESTERDTSEENILRSPTGLRPLYGDFGPTSTQVPGQEDSPSNDDLAAAFWVGTKQNGLCQTWAPRWSMFSRGNIKEKARLLAWAGTESQPSQTPCTAVDLYAGIGYFVFSYAQRGMRVLGWELNPWSTEALRRGALRNGWTVKIVRGVDLAQPTADIVRDEQIVIFVEDNQNAARRLAELRQSRALCITHVNGGLLPTSRPVWRTAWDAVVNSKENSDTKNKHIGWLHLHDNVGVEELDSRKAEIQALVDEWGAAAEGPRVESVVEHTELVKTFAPGVWHCVFDVRVSR